MSSNWTEESVNNTGFAIDGEEVVHPTPPAWTEQDPAVSDTSIVLSDGWNLEVDGAVTSLTFKYNSVSRFSINDNGTLGVLQLTSLPGDADIGSLAMKDGDLYIKKED